MHNTAVAPRGTNWIKVFGILALLGAVIAVARIVLRVFQEEPETEESHEAA